MSERSSIADPRSDPHALPDGTASMTNRLRELLECNHGTHRGWVRLKLANAEFVVGRLERWTRIRESAVRRVVFVCLGNINRSAFAHEAARRLGVEACSFGLSTGTGSPAFETAIRTAARFGVSLHAHRATDLRDHEPREGDLLAVMEVRHVKRLLDAGFAPESIVLLGRWASPMRLHIHDPHTLCDAYYRTCFAILDSAVRNLAAELATQGHPAVSR